MRGMTVAELADKLSEYPPMREVVLMIGDDAEPLTLDNIRLGGTGIQNPMGPLVISPGPRKEMYDEEGA